MNTAIPTHGLRVRPLFVPVERAGELDPTSDAGWMVPLAGSYRQVPPTPIAQLLVESAFPTEIEVGLDGIEPVLARLLECDDAPPKNEILRRIRFNHLGIDLDSIRAGTILNLELPIVRAPNRRELLASTIVRRAIEDAWLASNPDDPSQRHEEGGWIYLNLKSGELSTCLAPAGNASSIDLSRPQLFADSIVVGTFHTHPHTEPYEPGPSDSDENMDASRGVPGFVRSRSGYYAYGWEQATSLAGRTGFFPGTARRPLD